jgi:5-methylcytosine-specific restriction endonuclease McrA
MKRKQTKATDIPKRVKLAVLARDEGRCVWCGRRSAYTLPEAHYISRTRGGLGIEQNILTLCRFPCHDVFDHGDINDRLRMRARFREYLSSKYPDWDEAKLIYHKNGGNDA